MVTYKGRQKWTPVECQLVYNNNTYEYNIIYYAYISIYARKLRCKSGHKKYHHSEDYVLKGFTFA